MTVVEQQVKEGVKIEVEKFPTFGQERHDLLLCGEKLHIVTLQPIYNNGTKISLTQVQAVETEASKKTSENQQFVQTRMPAIEAKLREDKIHDDDFVRTRDAIRKAYQDTERPTVWVGIQEGSIALPNLEAEKAIKALREKKGQIAGKLDLAAFIKELEDLGINSVTYRENKQSLGRVLGAIKSELSQGAEIKIGQTLEEATAQYAYILNMVDSVVTLSEAELEHPMVSSENTLTFFDSRIQQIIGKSGDVKGFSKMEVAYRLSNLNFPPLSSQDIQTLVQATMAEMMLERAFAMKPIMPDRGQRRENSAFLFLPISFNALCNVADVYPNQFPWACYFCNLVNSPVAERNGTPKGYERVWVDRKAHLIKN